ncbi:RraA family protein [Actinomadura viridis]|uniref:Putative 4-hydroxy-4-methyl-2-oxoglutarate aldolase n=1 Tax=Actinomadura viridis TaxID=58110 RepID=A0A931DJ74_9ACTN|nr:RraA family protein [Actinomadura viridis]MBG6092189.1 regulator of RNase E activity RraA [Actinomadura viridis]
MPPTYPQEVIDAFRGITTASVADAVEQFGVRGYLTGGIRQIIPGKLVGPAVTVHEVPSDEAQPPTLALQAIDESEPGSVICIAAGGADVAVWGGLMAAGAVANGIAGAVLDAGVRDVEEILRDYSGLAIYARGSVPATTVGRYRTVSLNEPVEIGGVTVHPGDLIVADGDGVVRVPAEHVDAVLAAAGEIEDREREQARLIMESGSLRAGIAKYNRV